MAVTTPQTSLKSTKKRTLSRRGVMWLGQTCNARCYFCYFLDRIASAKHPEHAFMTLEKAKHICKTLREFYGNNAIDIQGGEPTIHPQILELCRYCHEIGLEPTLITNGLKLAKEGELEKYKEAGVRSFLVSLHGIGDIHDEVVCKKNAYEKIIGSIERMRELEIPFRFNCTMSKPVVSVIPEIAQKAIDYGALGVNFIAFNPFGDQSTGERRTETVAKYSDIKAQLTIAMDMLDEAGIECNIRYLPICMSEPRHRKNFYNFQQLPYDHHEWDYESWLWTMMQTQMMKDGDTTPPMRLGPYADSIYKLSSPDFRDKCAEHPIKMGIKFIGQRTLAKLEQATKGKATLYRREAARRASEDCGYQYHEGCQTCAVKSICDGFHGDYAGHFGTDEAVPITDVELVDDPLTFIREQEKTVEREDENWAL